MSKIGDLWVRLGLKKQDFDKGITDATKSTKSFGSTVSKQLSGVAAKFLSVAAAIKVLGDGIRTMATFERATATLASVLKTTVAGIKELTDSAKELGRTTEFTATDVTHLQTELARLGFQERDILNMQQSVLKFASAVNTDLASAATFAGGALRSFGLTSAETNRLLDVMAESTAKSALSFSKLETALGIVFPVANQFGLSVEDTTAMLGALSNVLPDASSAATALRNILMNLADSNGKLATSIGHSAQTFPEIVKAFEELSARGVDLNEVLGMSDKRSAAALAAFIGNTKALKDLRNAFDDCHGAVDQMYDTMTNNLVGSVRSLKSAWEGLMLSFQNSTGPIKDVVDWITKMLNKLTDFQNKVNDLNGSAGLQKQAQSYVDRIYGYYGGDMEAVKERIADDMADAERRYYSALGDVANASSRKAKKAAQEQVNRWKEVMDMLKLTDKPLQSAEAFNNRSTTTGGTTTPTGSTTPQLTEEQKNQIKQDKQRIEAIKQNSMEENQAMAARYEKDLALLKKYGQDTSSLSETFSKDLVSKLTIDAKPDDLLEGVMTAPERLQKHYDELLSIMEKYGLDSTSLREKFNLLMIQAEAEEAESFGENEEAMDKWQEQVLQTFEELNGLSLDPLDNELHKITEGTWAAIEMAEKALEKTKELKEQFLKAVVSGFSDGCQEIMDQLTGVSEINAGAIMQALIEPLADLAVKEGEILMATGLGVEAVKKALSSLEGVAAIAAGAALIAIGTAAKAGLKALAQNGTATTSTSTLGAGGSSMGGVQNLETELIITVEGHISGSDIVLAGQRTLNNWSR